MATEKSLEKDISADVACNEQTSLNLKYLVREQKSRPFPWQYCICALIIIVLAAVWGWQFTRKQEIAVLHKISRGETLRTIAIYYYGDPSEWYKIFLVNREKLLQSKTLIIGQKIKIPLSRKRLNEILAAREKQRQQR